MAAMDAPVTIHPEIMHGTPCFAGTRVPVKTLFDHLAGNYTVDEFLAQFPTVRREHVDAVLEQSNDRAEREAMRIAG